MEPRQSIYLILLLLAALVFGPVVVLTQDGRERPLRPIATNERLMDAPNSLPRPASAPFPDGGRGLAKGPLFR